jgi:hypothetical protein
VPDGGRWEQVWQGDGEGQAAIVAGGLEARGFPTRVHGYQPLPQAYPTAWARNHWAILVPASEADEAREHLRGSGEDANVVEGGPEGLRREQVFVLKLALLSLMLLVGACALGVLFFDASL